MRIAAPFPALILSWLIVSPAIGHPLDSTLMDKAVKPSEDFYTFANGAWLKNTPIPNDHSEWSGPLSNMAEFAGAFEDSENCPMSRPAARRVTIW